MMGIVARGLGSGLISYSNKTSLTGASDAAYKLLEKSSTLSLLLVLSLT